MNFYKIIFIIFLRIKNISVKSKILKLSNKLRTNEQ